MDSVSRDIYIRGLSVLIIATYFFTILKFKKLDSNLKTLHILSGLVLLYVVSKRDFYLSFLGYSVFPCEDLQEKVPENANVSIDVSNLPPNVNVVYWASESNEDSKKIEKNPWEAYKRFSNSGVVRTNSDGVATLSVRDPVQYSVGMRGGTLKKHIHYRHCVNNGMLSPVQTVYL